MSRIDKIVDISHHQEKPIDFGKLKDVGITAVIHKATQGTHFKDSKYVQRRKDAEQHGILWGAYHFSEDETDGGKQARYFLDFIGDINGIFLSLDYETYHHRNKPEVYHNMTIMEAENFVDEISQRIGRLPFFYSGNTIKKMLGARKSTKLGMCKLWVAGYVSESRLKIQNSWANWTLWQYTDGKPGHNPNPIAGFGSWDRSVFEGGDQDLSRIWSS
jgi:lysozyme